MSRYIDADKLYKEIEQIKAQAEEAVKNSDSMSCRMIATTQFAERDNFASLVCWIPTADVVEVVRCKDCKYWQDNNGGYPHEECRWEKDETPDMDDYCSYGERRDSND